MLDLLKDQKKRGKACSCQSCKRSRRLVRIAAKLPKKEGDFLLGMYDYLIEVEAELAMAKAASRN